MTPSQTAISKDLANRFAVALEQVQAKLVKLVASAPLLMVAIVIVLVSLWAGRVISRRVRVLSRFSRSNPYMDGLLRRSVQFLIVLAGVLMALDLLGATSLVGAVLGSAGVVGLVMGFAFKDIAENYIAGVLLSLRQPFSPGDAVRVENHEGKVVALTSRVTILMTADGNHLQLPNGLVFKSVLLNYSRNSKRRFEFDAGVDAHASLHQAMDIGIAALATMQGVLAEPGPSALIRSLSSDGATLQFHGWIDQGDNDLARTRSEAMRVVRKALREEGINPPEAIQKVVVLRADAAADDAYESDVPRDTSVDHTLDAQVGEARHQEDGGDLLSQRTAQAGHQLP